MEFLQVPDVPGEVFVPVDRVDVVVTTAYSATQARVRVSDSDVSDSVGVLIGVNPLA